MNDRYSTVNQRLPRKDSYDKATGDAKYINDYVYPNMLYGGAVLSKIPHARIKSVNTEKAKHMPGVKAVLTHADIPGENKLAFVIIDQPILVVDKINRIGDSIALVAAETKEQLEAAIEAVEVEYEPLEGVFSVERALEPDAPRIHGKDNNILLKKRLERGNVEEAFKQCDVIVEQEYTTPRLAHMFLEPEGAVAHYENGRMTVYACLQYAHLARDEVAKALALPRSQVRVIFPTVGGGFGGKEDNGLLCHAAMLAKYTNRAVKMVHSRIESSVVGTKRHPFFIKAKTGAAKDGHVLAHDVYMLADTGAYADAGPVVATRAIMHFMGPYNIPNIRGECILVYTNNPISGAFRGFGAPQATICYEGQMNALARRLKMDPLELRILNAHRVGSVTATGQVLKESVGFIETIKKAREKADAVMGKQSMVKENE